MRKHLYPRKAITGSESGFKDNSNCFPHPTREEEYQCENLSIEFSEESTNKNHVEFSPDSRYGANACHFSNNYRKYAFTLAETLITLLIIGVVAVLTIPALAQNISDYTLSKQRTVFEKKFDEGLKQMRVDGKLEETYESTEDFVNKMKRYFKLAQVCDKDSLKNCFPASFTAKALYKNAETNSKTFNTTDIKTTKNLYQKAKYDTNVMGIKFTDGTSILLTYDSDCRGIESGDTKGNTKKCFGYIADVNGNKNPNVTGKDILTNMYLIYNFGLSFEITEFASPTTFGYIPAGEETEEFISKYGLQKKSGIADDYWAGAMVYCQDKGYKLPTIAQFEEIAKKLYIDSGVCTEPTSISGDYQATICDVSELTALPLWQAITNGGANSISLWTNEVYDGHNKNAYRSHFNISSRNCYSNERNYQFNAICIEE